MSGSSNITSDESIIFADNASFDGTERGGKLTTNGQLWVGSSNSPHVKKGNIISPSGSLSIGYSSPNITIDVNGGSSIGNINGDSGSITGSTVTIYSNVASINSGSSVSFVNSGTTSTLNLTDANSNTLLGESNGNSIISGSGNTAVGSSSFTSLTSGSNNIAIGYQALSALTTEDYNIAIGSQALNACLVSNTVAVGSQALYHLTTGTGNTAVGDEALTTLVDGSNNTAIGKSVLQESVSGVHNTAIGFSCLESNTGDTNTCVGSLVALGIGNGSNNALFGFQTGNALTNGNNNSGFGYAPLNVLTTGSNNSGFGFEALFSLETGSYNLALGYNAGNQLNAAESSNIYLSHTGITGESNVMRLGTTGSGDNQVNQAFIAATFGTTVGISGLPVVVDNTGQLGTVVSSKSFKENIQDLGSLSKDILKLRPVVFNYISDKEKHLQYGLIAEEVQDVMPNLVVRDENDKIMSVKYHELPVLILNEFQKILKRLNEIECKIRK